jgi:hypothetical protein
MVNFESALTFGRCPIPQPKTYVFFAPPAAITAFEGAHTTLVTEANNHGEDCGRPGLLQALSIRARTRYHIIGIGKNVAGALAADRHPRRAHRDHRRDPGDRHGPRQHLDRDRHEAGAGVRLLGPRASTGGRGSEARR